jgi:TolB-like protein/DNA-binding winged helix-turn-helix (wHTH) protein/tetratricopeptide (TPR) repeat protein
MPTSATPPETDAAPVAGEGPVVRLSAERPFRLGDIEVDPSSRVLRRADGAAEGIEPRVMQVLVMLARSPGEVVGRAALNAGAWGGLSLTDDALNRVIGRLRRHAEEFAHGSFGVETVPRVGFRLVGEVTRPGEPEAAVASKPNRRAMIIGASAAAAGLAAGGAWLAWSRRDRVPPAPAGVTRVTVLPFDYLGTGPETRFLATGLPREIREQLSRVAGLQLIAEPSSRAASAAAASAQAAGRRLGARYVVTGAVAVAGPRIRVRADLVDVSSGETVASTLREGGSDKLFELQDAVSGALLRELVGRAGAALPALRAPAPRDSRAYALVLQGQDLLEASRTARMEERAEAAFDLADRSAGAARAALAVDADNPGALLLMAQLTRNGWTRALAARPLSADQRVEASIGYVSRALAVEPNDPAALTALGDYYRRFRWRWAEAETLFRKALRINPSFVEAHWSYGYMLGVMGRALEGLSHAAAVFRLDPETTWRRVALPRLLYVAGDREGALKRYDVELRTTPANLFLITEVYIVHLTEADAAALDRLAATVRGLQGRRAPSPALSSLLAKIGEAAEALRGRPEAYLRRIDAEVSAYDGDASGLAPSQARASIDLLFIYAIEAAWGGAADKAIGLLQRALAGRSLYWPATLPWGPTPFPAAVRAHPRFAALWQSDPGLSALVAMRRRALDAGQMAGIGPDGKMRRPAPAAVRKALG